MVQRLKRCSGSGYKVAFTDRLFTHTSLSLNTNQSYDKGDKMEADYKEYVESRIEAGDGDILNFEQFADSMSQD